MFCRVSPLGAHVSEEVRQKIWDNAYVDIWSLITVDQSTVDKERRMGDRPMDRKPRVAKTIGNWLQAFAVLGCVLGQKHPERCSELFVYLDIIYNAYRSHGGSAWWRYDEEFRRRLALQPGVGWGSKATDVWLRIMTALRAPAPPFPGGANGSHGGGGSVAVKRPGTCWLFNEGHCRFYGLCKFKHECSTCGGGILPPSAQAVNRVPASRTLGRNPRTPVSVAAMEPWLNCYPRREATGVLRLGFGQGFFIPFHLSWAPSFADNLRSAKELPWVLRDKIAEEVELGRIAGPYASPPFSNLRVSPLGVVPKKELGKYRLIHHLSYPKGESVNDGISKEEASVSYVSFDRAVCLVRRAGRGALLAKSDIESAFRLLPVHPDCFHLLGCYLDGHYYYDMCLPMGCSISCHYFELFSSFLEWVVRYETGSTAVTHYLDDFLFVGPADSQHCSFLLDTFRFFMARFGVPLSAEKTEGPVTTLSFLGIELYTVSMVFRLPQEKLTRLLDLIEGFCAVRKVTLLQMQSMLGLLVFACRVMPMGRVFSRRLSLATKGARSPGHRIRLTKPLKADLGVW